MEVLVKMTFKKQFPELDKDITEIYKDNYGAHGLNKTLDKTFLDGIKKAIQKRCVPK